MNRFDAAASADWDLPFELEFAAELDPFELTGPVFLALYVALFGLVVAARLLIRSTILNPSRSVSIDPRALTPLDIAYLSGGEAAAVDAALAILIKKGRVALVNGRLVPASPGELYLWNGVHRRVAQHESEEPLEAELFAAIRHSDGSSVEALRRVLLPSLEGLRRRLELLGLLVPKSPVLWLATPLPALLLAAFGIVKIGVGIARERPVMFLLLFVVGTCVYAHFARGSERVTVPGRKLLLNLRAQNDALSLTARSAAAQLLAGDAALAYALFGSAALTGALGPLGQAVMAAHSSVDLDIAEERAQKEAELRKASGASGSCGSTSSSCGSSGGSSCSGSSCSGGGCGGCGGGGGD